MLRDNLFCYGALLGGCTPWGHARPPALEGCAMQYCRRKDFYSCLTGIEREFYKIHLLLKGNFMLLGVCERQMIENHLLNTRSTTDLNRVLKM